MSHRNVFVYPAAAAASVTVWLTDPYGGRQYGRGFCPVPARRMASASVSSARIRAASNEPVQGAVVGEPPPPRARSQWYIVWFAISNSWGLARMIAMTWRPLSVSLITPVAKIVAHTRRSTRKFMMSTAGSIRPPMSNVSATPVPAPGMVRKVCADPAATRLLAVQPEPDGRGVGFGVAGGADAGGNGVGPGSSLTTRIQPGSMMPGFVSSEAYLLPFHAL